MDVFPNAPTQVTAVDAGKGNWVERQLAQTSWVMLIGLPILIPLGIPLVWILSLIGLFAAHQPKARTKAIVAFTIFTILGLLIALLIIQSRKH